MHVYSTIVERRERILIGVLQKKTEKQILYSIFNSTYPIYKASPDVIHKLVALVAESDCVWIPLDLQSLQSGAVLCKALYHLINVHLALDPEKPSIGSSQYTDSVTRNQHSSSRMGTNFNFFPVINMLGLEN